MNHRMLKPMNNSQARSNDGQFREEILVARNLVEIDRVVYSLQNSEARFQELNERKLYVPRSNARYVAMAFRRHYPSRVYGLRWLWIFVDDRPRILYSNLDRQPVDFDELLPPDEPNRLIGLEDIPISVVIGGFRKSYTLRLFDDSTDGAYEIQ